MTVSKYFPTLDASVPMSPHVTRYNGFAAISATLANASQNDLEGDRFQYVPMPVGGFLEHPRYRLLGHHLKLFLIVSLGVLMAAVSTCRGPNSRNSKTNLATPSEGVAAVLLLPAGNLHYLREVDMSCFAEKYSAAAAATVSFSVPVCMCAAPSVTTFQTAAAPDSATVVYFWAAPLVTTFEPAAAVGSTTVSFAAVPVVYMPSPTIIQVVEQVPHRIGFRLPQVSPHLSTTILHLRSSSNGVER